MSVRMIIANKWPSRWAISRNVFGTWIHLIQGSRVAGGGDEEPERVLAALGIPLTSDSLNSFFPRNACGERCPSYELMALWYDYGQVEGQGHIPSV